MAPPPRLVEERPPSGARQSGGTSGGRVVVLETVWGVGDSAKPSRGAVALRRFDARSEVAVNLIGTAAVPAPTRVLPKAV